MPEVRTYTCLGNAYFVTVIIDGGWSKRSHRHSYNAKSGVAIILGRWTGKLLHIGICNKYSTVCVQGVPKQKHKKTGTSPHHRWRLISYWRAFSKAEATHGLRYTYSLWVTGVVQSILAS